MHRKVEMWLVCLLMILGVVFTIGFGFLVGQELRGKTRFQPFSTYALLIAELPLKLKQAYAQVFRLELALPDDPGSEFEGFWGNQTLQKFIFCSHVTTETSKRALLSWLT